MTRNLGVRLVEGSIARQEITHPEFPLTHPETRPVQPGELIDYAVQS